MSYKFSSLKSGFTLVELLVSVVLLGIIIGAASYYYYGVQQKSKTEQNYYYANEIIQAVERFKGINTSGSRYPIKNEGLNSVISQDSDFMDLISESNQSNISFDKNKAYPSSDNPTIIYFESCYKSRGLDKIPQGVVVYYWDLVAKNVKNLSSGKTQADPDTICF